MHRGAQTRRRRRFAVSQGSFEGLFDTLRDVHCEASLTRCTTFVNLGVIFVQTLDSHGRGSYVRKAFSRGGLARWLSHAWLNRCVVQRSG